MPPQELAAGEIVLPDQRDVIRARAEGLLQHDHRLTQPLKVLEVSPAQLFRPAQNGAQGIVPRLPEDRRALEPLRGHTLNVERVVTAAQIVAEAAHQVRDERVREERRIVVGDQNADGVLVRKAKVAGAQIGAVVEARDGGLYAPARLQLDEVALAAHRMGDSHDRYTANPGYVCQGNGSLSHHGLP